MKKVTLFVTVILSTALLVACGNKKETKESTSMEKTSESSQTMMSSSTMSSTTMSSSMMGQEITGNFKSEDGHDVSGMIQIEDGQLTLTNFKTDSGPDLHVYLAKDGDVSDGVDLGEIDLEKSDQTFDISAENVDKYNTVLIYCNKAHELFGKAMYRNKMARSHHMSGQYIVAPTRTVVGTAKMDGYNLMHGNFKTDDSPYLHEYLMERIHRFFEKLS